MEPNESKIAHLLIWKDSLVLGVLNQDHGKSRKSVFYGFQYSQTPCIWMLRDRRLKSGLNPEICTPCRSVRCVCQYNHVLCNEMLCDQVVCDQVVCDHSPVLGGPNLDYCTLCRSGQSAPQCNLVLCN